jgi:hypothetical protein
MDAGLPSEPWFKIDEILRLSEASATKQSKLESQAHLESGTRFELPPLTPNLNLVPANRANENNELCAD